jgi:hypothetical protein
VTITLPDELRDALERKAREAGFATVAEFVTDLVEEAVNDSAPAELCPKDRTELEAMLDAGMNSGPPVRVTSEFWEQRRKALEERMARPAGEAP